MKLTPYAKDCLRRYPMTLQEAAARIVPLKRAPLALIHSLESDPFTNTLEDEKTLVAAIVCRTFRSKRMRH